MQKTFYALLTTGLLLLGGGAHAQTVFAPHGAEWWYVWQGLIIPPAPYTHARVVGDTVLGGQPARKLLVEELWDDTGTGYRVQFAQTYFVRTTGDDVLSWEPATAMYRLEYRFNRVSGNQWSVPACQSGATIDFVVDSTVARLLGNAVLRYQYSSIQGPSGGRDLAVERVGRLGGIAGPVMFPRAYCGPGAAEAIASLVSYSDSTVRVGTVPVLHRPDELPLAHLTIGPNPASDGRFRCDGITTETVSYEVVDGVGRRVRRSQLSAAAPELDLSNQPPGLYLLRGHVAGKAFTRRLVRE